MRAERYEYRAWTHVSVAVLSLAALPATGEPADGEALAAAVEEAAGDPGETAREIIQRSGVRGGLVVHLGCGDGRLTAALRAGESYLVQGLERDAARREQARAHIRSAGLYGPVSVAAWDGLHLPYAENLVNLIVSETPGDVAMDELLRVLAPRGVTMVKRDVAWTKTGLFYIIDQGPAATVAMPPRWTLVARDAFSGVRLWERLVEPWEWHLRAFRSGPTDLARRLVAVGNRVYVTLG